MNLSLRQFAGLRGHLVGLAAIDHGNNRILTITMQPDVIGQIWRTHCLVALAIQHHGKRAHAANLGLPREACTESWGLPDKTQDIVARRSSHRPRAHCCGHWGHHAHAPVGDGFFDFSGEPPYSQSLSARLGNPLEPRASEAWHWAQLFMNKRSPMAMACGSRDTSSDFMSANLAYRGATSELPLATSFSYVLDQPIPRSTCQENYPNPDRCAR
jgi:hypothetical protein